MKRVAVVFSLVVLFLIATYPRKPAINPPVEASGGFGSSPGADTGVPLPATPEERRILDVALATPRYANVPVADGRVLRLLTEAIDAKKVVEFGTSTGVSGLWFAMALVNTGGRLTTFEIDKRRIAIARQQFARAGVANLIDIVEGDAHKEVLKLKGPVDLAFIDADKPGYVDYLFKIMPLVRPGGLILAHNVHSPPPDPEFMKAITTDPDLDTIFVNMDDQGLSISLKKR